MPYFTANGQAKIYYQSIGHGIPIIFIHPPLLTGVNFMDQQRFLSSRYRPITFDIRGHGHSTAGNLPLTYPLITQDIVRIMKQLHLPKAVLCGYSTGGTVALDAMLSHPEKFYGAVLISAMSEVSDWWLLSRIRFAVMMSRNKHKTTLAHAIAYGNASDPQTRRLLYEDAMHGTVESWEQYYRHSLTYHCTHRLHRIKAPVLLAYGKKDKTFHHYAAMLYNQLPYREWYSVKHAKHQLPTKASQPLNELIDYWISEKFLNVSPSFKILN